MSFIKGESQGLISLLPACVNDYVAPDALVRIVDAFVVAWTWPSLRFNWFVAATTGRPGYRPGDMLRLYIWGYLNQVRSSRHLERACVRDLEALWLMRRSRAWRSLWAGSQISLYVSARRCRIAEDPDMSLSEAVDIFLAELPGW